MEVTITMESKNDRHFLRFDFPDHLDVDTATAAIAVWKQEMTRYTTDDIKINLIFNCSCMKGFDTAARKYWQQTMKELKDNIGVIWIVCENVFILGAAKTMGILTNFNIKAVRSLEEVK